MIKTTLLATGRQHGGWREEIKTDGVAFHSNLGGFLETLICALSTLLSLVSIGIKLAKQSGSGQLQKGCKVINLKPRQVFLSCPERARPWVALDGPYHGRATLHTFVIRSDFAKLFCTKNHLHVVD